MPNLSRKSLFVAILSLLSVCNVCALSTSYYASSSVLSSGKWVKIATNAEGIYQITYDQLSAMGFDNPSKVQVYGYGAVQLTNHSFSESIPDDLTPTATLHSDNRILFFGQGGVVTTVKQATGISSFTIARNNYDTRSYYFLTEVENIAEIPVNAYTTTPDSYSKSYSHIHLELVDEELQNPCKGGISFHGKKYDSGQIASFPFQIKNFLATASEEQGSFTYVFGVSSTSTSTLTLSASSNISTNTPSYTKAWDITDGDYTVFNEAKGTIPFSETSSKPLQNANVEFNVNIPSQAYRYCAVDYTLLRYPRANLLDDDTPALIMYQNDIERKDVSIKQFAGVKDGEVCVWNIDNPSAISGYECVFVCDDDASQTGTMSYTVAANTSRTIAFRPSATYPEPEILGQIANQDLHATATPDMLIITTEALQSIASQLAELHREHQSMDVNVVVHDQIFNEFSSGSRDAMAYRRFAKMYFDRDPEKFKYILFFGNGHYDNRGIETPNPGHLIVYENTNATQTRNNVTNYASDNYFGMLRDDYNHAYIFKTQMDVVAARVPAITPSQGQSYVDKVRRYLTNRPSAEISNRAIVISGRGDLNTHLMHALEVESTMLAANPDLVVVPIHVQAYKDPSSKAEIETHHNILDQQLKSGAGYLSFSGHGSPISIDDKLITTQNALKRNYDNPPFVMISSCDQYAYDHMQNGLVENLLFAENGGAIGGVGATRSVYISFNQAVCANVAKAYAERRSGETFGDIYLRSRAYTLAIDNVGDGALINAMNYNLAGDPALPVSAPSLSAQISSVGGETFAGSATVLPLKATSFVGSIVDSDGNKVTDFNGTATITIFESPTTSSTYNTNNESSYESVEVSIGYDILNTVEATVVNGEFTAEVVLPVATVPNGTHTILVSAVDSKDESRMALAKIKSITIGEYNPDNYTEAELAAPEILEFYVDSPDFTSGDEVAPMVDVYAIIAPPASGLMVGTSGIATRTRLTLDNLQQTNNLEGSLKTLDDGNIELHTILTELSEGRHTLNLVATSNANESDHAKIDFVVVTRVLDAVATINESPARTEATINLSNAEASENKLVITNMEGNTVFTASNVTFPYTWNLKSSAGEDMANGRYNVSVQLRDGRYYGHTPVQELIIVR